ncbi:RtcB family protein [Planktothricoides raciborskii]|uniref:RtcB family protein n=1 Tax=Planktothricoides raciborskii TaxID=132608 RepID=UPI0035C903C7
MPYEQLKISTPKPVLSWANHELGSEETAMAKNVASLPFVFKHVALMPDVHLGKGALVGSVLATKDAIIPAAVGVDIGCFTGDTLVPLADGKSYSLAELASWGREFVVYSCTNTGRIVAAKAIARLTRRNAPLVKVVLDNGAEILCTPDHQFMLRDGSYREAKDLNNGTSLMPFYSKTYQDGYTLIQQNDSGEYQVFDNGKRGKNYLIDYNTSEKGRAKSKEIANRIYTCETCGDEVKTPIGLHNHRRKEHGYNHKVVEVVSLEEQQDVYCLTVPEYHNFALTAGVFVHNCGMCAVKTPFFADKLEGKLKKIRQDIEAAIPLGFDENKDVDKPASNWQGWRDFKDLHAGVQRLEGKAMKQLGSLGGGNHFIEVCLDTDNQVWLMLHSGSRHIGNMLAQCHIDTAKELARLAGDRLPDPDLAYFVSQTPEFDAYWHDLQWAQNYARKNRDVMMDRFMRIVEKHLAGGKPTKPLLLVNCHHNYAEKETHFGEQVYVTRKGAVRAREEDYGIIPGSMGAKSFIVKGKGCADSYCSCSHGAGRLMSRNKAKKEFTEADLIEQTQGIECRKDRGVLDEIPGAYKPIEQVMENQSDLVEIVATLKQVVCVKG